MRGYLSPLLKLSMASYMIFMWFFAFFGDYVSSSRHFWTLTCYFLGLFDHWKRWECSTSVARGWRHLLSCFSIDLVSGTAAAYVTGWFYSTELKKFMIYEYIHSHSFEFKDGCWPLSLLLIISVAPVWVVQPIVENRDKGPPSLRRSMINSHYFGTFCSFKFCFLSFFDMIFSWVFPSMCRPSGIINFLPLLS